MGHLERAFEWLRPLVLDSDDAWDYCVLWKLGDDPSRFIEWIGCCCNGGKKQDLKKRKKVKNNSMQVCKDTYLAHLANTKSCQALARFPSSMSIYSGLHGEVVISSQPRWLTITKTSNLKESCGTHVLIPVYGGLVELYSSKQIEEDESIIHYVKAQFNFYSELETMTASAMSFDGQSVNTFIDKGANSCLTSLNQSSTLAWPQPLIPIAHHFSDSTLDGSSTGSFPSDKRPSPDSNPSSVSHDVSLKLQPACHEDITIPKNKVEGKHRLGKGPGKSKNIVSERNRRQRINNGILSLRALVPKITKMHKAATLSDASDYIEELNNEIRELQRELRSWTEEDCAEKNNALKLRVPHLDEKVRNHKQANTYFYNKRLSLEVNVQVSQLGGGNYVLKIACQQRLGAYTKLLEALESLGLPIKDANLTTCDGKISTIFTVQSNEKVIEEQDVRASLARLTA